MYYYFGPNTCYYEDTNKIYNIFQAKRRAIYDQFGEEGLRNGVPDTDTGKDFTCLQFLNLQY